MRSLILSLTIAAGLVAGITSSNVGCSAADAAFDCHSVCSRYKDCIDKNYDVSQCTDRCRDKAADDKSYRDKADQCESCIDDKSCASATFTCPVCGGIVP
ncbi:MAG: hypothetical protein ABIS92_12330 [Polyangia bacterium]